MALVQLFSLLLLFPLIGECTTPGMPGDCNIPTAPDGNPIVHFTTSPVMTSVDTNPTLGTFEEQFFEGDSCRVTLYLKSAILDPFPIPFELAGTTFFCMEMNSTGVTSNIMGNGTVLKYRTGSVQRPPSVPVTWYENNRLVMQTDFYLSSNASVNVRCELGIQGDGTDILIWTDLQVNINGTDAKMEQLMTSSTPATTTMSAAEIQRLQKCHVASTDKAVPGNDVIDFQPFAVRASIFIFDIATVSGKVYELNECKSSLFMKADRINNGVPKGLRLHGENMICEDKATGMVLGRGKVLKYQAGFLSRPASVPAEWYVGRESAVLQVDFDQVLGDLKRRIRCYATTVVIILPITISLEIDVIPTGCPETHWGNKCQNVCPCQNGGICHSSTGVCLCQTGTSGGLCEIVA